jgi:hypothetical protein
MHADELDTDDALAHHLVGEQFPGWDARSLLRIEPSRAVLQSERP